MAYYKKTEIMAFMKEVIDRAQKSEIRIVTDPQEAARAVGSDADLVAMFWIEQHNVEDSENLKIGLEGKVFVKIDFDLYSDDRYAVDSYQACKEGTTVSDVVRKREKETEEARAKLTEEEVRQIKEKVENKNLFDQKS